MIHLPRRVPAMIHGSWIPDRTGLITGRRGVHRAGTLCDTAAGTGRNRWAGR
ncbi:hypothetical protein GCM10020367_60300 [Streptomyces sannanensis]|uniref:Dioxygenase n=1 Tax=Streptomyces sannanensis TaxID=285536 RepID=A0ABP6SKT8_9ACTN